MHEHKIDFATGFLLALALAPAASADLITWGPVQNVTDPSNVSLAGTLVTARNCWASTFAAPTVNGVPFSAFAPLGWDNGGWTLNAGSSTGDAEYDALLDSARVTGGPLANPTGFGGIRLDTLGTLTVGRHYQVQVWYSDQRLGTPTNVLNDRVMTLSSATGAALLNAGLVSNLSALNQGPLSAGLDADPNNISGPSDSIIGSFCVGTFTRTTNDQLWLLVEGSHPLANNVLLPHVNAFQIREVPNLGLGTNYCIASPNSTGTTAVMSAIGSATAVQNDLTLAASRLPLNAFGYFLTSATQGLSMNPGGSQGTLCLGGSIGRYVGPGQIKNSGTSGSISLVADLTQHPTPTGFVAVQAGQTWNFTAWYRDAVAGSATSNFADGLELTFN